MLKKNSSTSDLPNQADVTDLKRDGRTDPFALKQKQITLFSPAGWLGSPLARTPTPGNRTPTPVVELPDMTNELILTASHK